MVIPLMIAAVVWAYDIVKIAQRAGGKEDNRENDKEDNGSEEDTITNSIDAIRHIRQLKQSDRIEGGRHEESDY